MGAEHGWTTKSIKYLAELYNAWQKPRQAEEWQARLPVEQDTTAKD